MKRLSLLAACVGVSAIFNVASAEDLRFSFTALGGAIPNVGGTDTGISVFPLTMDPAHSDPGFPIHPYPMQNIALPPLQLELVLTGLTHTRAEDLDIFLIDPFGKTLEIMTDRGIGSGLSNVNLIFNDIAAGLPPENGQINNGTYLPEDSDGTGGFSKYVGGSGGTDAWILLVIDDAPGGQGGLESFTVRAVPEPVTLSLLALGALTALRRSRRKY